MQEDIKFDFPADLTGIGDRSVHEIYEVVLYLLVLTYAVVIAIVFTV